MVELKDMHSSPPARAPKLQLAIEQPSTGKHWNPPKKRYPTSKDKGEATKKQQEGHNHNTMKSHTRQVGGPKTGEQKYQRSPPTVMQVLNPTSGFPT